MPTPPIRIPCRLCARVRLGLEFGEDAVALLCFECAERLFTWVKAADEEKLRQVWRYPPRWTDPLGAESTATVRPTDAFDLIEQLRNGDARAHNDDGSLEDVRAELQRGVALVSNAEDWQVHLDLGLAFREMGFVRDSVAEWISVVIGKTSPQSKRMALSQIFDRVFLQQDGVEKLRTLLFPG